MFRSLSHFAASRVRSGLTWAEPQGQGLTRGIVRCLEIQESRPVLLPDLSEEPLFRGGAPRSHFRQVFAGFSSDFSENLVQTSAEGPIQEMREFVLSRFSLAAALYQFC